MSERDQSAQADQSCVKNDRQGEVEEEVFTLVTRRKNGPKTASASAALRWITNNPSTTPSTTPSNTALPGWSSPNISGKKKKASSRSQRYAPVEKTTEWGLSTIKERRSTLTESKFYQSFRDLVLLRLSPLCKASSDKIEPRGSIDSRQDNEAEDAAESSTQPTAPPVVGGMVCYGIGSIEGSRNAQFQLSLALELKDILQIRPEICIFDPAMTSLDKEVARALDMHVLEKDEALPSSILDSTILYFMPHCPKGLYSHVLEKNWTRQGLDRTVIFGNRFSMYHESPNYKTIARQAPFIFPALAIAEEYALPAIKFDDNTAFNDLAIHVFPSHQTLPDPDVSEREIDPEML